ncbi:MAG: helix-turn-helix transcriptional regulator [Clostridia bacterium]|nr:helix-turn-helix transcriptional regulator [Clostridia bacterium]
MIKYCRLSVAGIELAPYNWQNNVDNYIYRILYVHSGGGGYLLGEEKIPFKTGFLYLIPSYANIATYSSYESDQMRLNHTYVNFELIPPIISNNVIEINPNENSNLRCAVDVLNSLCARCHRRKFGLNEEELKYLENTVIFLIETMVKSSNAYIVNDETIISALQIMHNELPKKISVAEIAKRCFLTPEGFSQKFIKFLGEPPYSYLKKLKVRTALQLRDSGMKLDEIAAACGYSDASSLLHAIKSVK